jgi:hypothetical protein
MSSVFIKVTIWLFMEVLLTLIGMDDLADYGEYTLKVRESSTHYTESPRYN